MNTVQLTKRNARLFAKIKKETTGTSDKKVLDSVRYGDCSELLQYCRELYGKMGVIRKDMSRNTMYVFGDQWKDYIKDPDSEYAHDEITEEEYIMRNGKVPLKYNIMNKSKKAVVGLYRNMKNEPVAIARDRDEQKLGEMMTVAMQYAYQSNYIAEMNARLLEQCFCTGIFARSCYYRRNDERQLSDVYVQNENPYKIFFNDVEDVLFRDLHTIGALRDMTFRDLVSAFASDESDVRALSEEYASVQHEPAAWQHTYFGRKKDSERNFYIPEDPSLCRVIELWKKESERCYYCHDTAKGEESYRPLKDKAAIDAENERRISEMTELGYGANDASLIEYKWIVRTYWYVRYLTPSGKCLKEGESPFEHGSHPFTLYAFPMINGEVHSPASELIDTQRAINRTLTQIDFMRQNGAKNTLVVDENIVPGKNYRKFVQNYTKNGSVLFVNAKPGVQMPFQLKSSLVSPGDIEIIKLYMQLNEDISGLSGALKGEKANANTPASLYAQEAQNSSNNISDFLGWFASCVRSADSKMMKVIQQYYTDKRYIPIAGKNFSEEAKWYNPEKIRQSEFDLAVGDGISTTAYRMAMENVLIESLKAGFIDFKTFLEASNIPYADYLLEIVKRNEQHAYDNSSMPDGIMQTETGGVQT